MSETYDNKAINGKELAEQTLLGVASEIKREGCVSAAAFNEVVARLVALEKDVAEPNLGDRTADSLDAQSLKVGGTDVADATDHTVTFSQASSRGTAANDFASGSKLSTLFGKVKKWFADLGSAAFKNVPSSGNASSSQVVLGNDSRLSDSREPTSHTHTTNQITDFPSIPSAYTSTPNMDGIGSAGSSGRWSRGDHTHPSDTSKQDALPYCEASHCYEIDIAGSATSIRGGTPTYYSTDALFIPLQADAPSGTNWAGIFNDALDRLANKGRVIAYYSGAKTSSTTYEKYVPAAYVYRSSSASGTIEEIHFTEVLDDLHDTTTEKYHGLIREYTLKPSGWESISGTTHWPYYAEKAGDANTAVNAANDVNGVPITITKNSGGLISAIGAALIHASKADTDANGLSLTLTIDANGRVNAIGNRSIYAAVAGEAVSAYKDDNLNVIHEYYGRKQLYQWLGSSGTIGLTTGSTNVLWLEDRLGVDEYKPERKPEVHFFTVDINFIGIDISGFSSVGASLQLYTTAREGVETVQDIFLGESAIVVPAGNSSHHIVIPFQNSTPYVKFRPRLAVQFQLPLKNGVTQQCFFSRWYTSLAY